MNFFFVEIKKKEMMKKIADFSDKKNINYEL